VLAGCTGVPFRILILNIIDQISNLSSKMVIGEDINNINPLITNTKSSAKDYTNFTNTQPESESNENEDPDSNRQSSPNPESNSEPQSPSNNDSNDNNDDSNNNIENESPGTY
jgi:hypothetical protein